MIKFFLDTSLVKLPKKDQPIFFAELDTENVERVFIISFLGIFFFVLLLLLDIQRIQTGKFDESYVYKVSMFLHLSLGLFIIPALLIQRNAKEISSNEFKYTRFIIHATILLMTVILVPMALCATKDRNSLMTFVVYMILINLFLTIPIKRLFTFNVIILLILTAGVYLIEKNNATILTVALIEAVGVVIPIFIIAFYQYNVRVSHYLNEKQIIEQNLVIQKSLEEDFNQRLVQIEMRALRAQMNPHFIFNVLNSIKLFMVQNDGPTAANYLTKFAKLIRLILNNSKSQMIMMEDELESLKLYIEIENFRFNNKFDYKIQVPDNIDLEFVELPPLILQPYVENAIWHGLMHKREGRGMLRIDVKMIEDESIVFTIEDNGIGRKAAAEMKSNSARKTQFKSIGMELTKDRLAMTNQFYGTNASIEVIDLENDKGEASGTRVVVRLPIT
ncbi:MAG: sensor histidine kinase YesM [Paraglaciecola sp.]|jgi:sensor histidine kinase YesM